MSPCGGGAVAEIVSIAGRSGAGKSTLIKLLIREEKPTQGQVLFEGHDVYKMEEAALSRFRNKEIGFVFQFHHLLPEFTAIENVMMPGLINKGARGQRSKASYQEIMAKAEKLLDEMGLSERKGHRPGELSGGEQQRVAVARALILEPKAVLADEPTGNLDTQTGEELFNLLVNLNKEKGITFVIVTHNESLSGRCHRVLRMVDGKVDRL